MSQPFAIGRKALGICDRCGFTYLLHELRNQVVDLRQTGLLVCPTCLDGDQPQLQLGSVLVSDPQALENPRLDTGEDASRFGDAVRYDFLTDVDGWVANDAAVALSWVSSGDLRLVGDPGEGDLPKFNKSVSISTNPSTGYNKIVMRIRAADDPDEPFGVPDAVSWLGGVSWTSDGASGSAVSTNMPVWIQMGDPYTVVSWDLSSVATWSDEISDGVYSIVNNIEFGLFDVNGEVIRLDIDYIRIQNWSDQS